MTFESMFNKSHGENNIPVPKQMVIYHISDFVIQAINK